MHCLQATYYTSPESWGHCLSICDDNDNDKDTHKDEYKDRDEENDKYKVIKRPITFYIFEKLLFKGFAVKILAIWIFLFFLILPRWSPAPDDPLPPMIPCASASLAHHPCIIKASSLLHQWIIKTSSAHHQCIISASSKSHPEFDMPSAIGLAYTQIPSIKLNLSFAQLYVV